MTAPITLLSDPYCQCRDCLAMVWGLNIGHGIADAAALSLALRHETRAFLKSCGDQVLPSNVPPGWNAMDVD